METSGVDILPKDVKQCPHTCINSALMIFKNLNTRRIIVIGSTFAYFEPVFLLSEISISVFFGNVQDNFFPIFQLTLETLPHFIKIKKQCPRKIRTLLVKYLPLGDFSKYELIQSIPLKWRFLRAAVAKSGS